MISAAEAGTLPGLLERRIEATPNATAYRECHGHEGNWQSYSWARIGSLVGAWQAALRSEGLVPGDRVAVWLKNGVAWVAFEQAALSLGLVVVPLYLWDSTANVAHILTDSGARLLLVGAVDQAAVLGRCLRSADRRLRRIVCLEAGGALGSGRVVTAQTWLQEERPPTTPLIGDPDALATIIYTSGTTRQPKGVMLSHRNLLANAEAVLLNVASRADDVFLSVLPLAHAFERTVGYYTAMMGGCEVAFARSAQTLAADLRVIRPTIMITVPRLLEHIADRIRQQAESGGAIARASFDLTQTIGWQRFLATQDQRRPEIHVRCLWPVLRAAVAAPVRAGLGGRLRLMVSGGAQLDPKVGRIFLALGLPLVQGYGLTEAGPVVSANTPADNRPESAGRPLHGVEVQLTANRELLVRSPGVMLGYWRDPIGTRSAVDDDGWLRTGDLAEVRDGRLLLRGRLVDAIGLSTGHDLPVAELEAAICGDPLIEQTMLVGQGRPHPIAIAVLARERWYALAAEHGVDPEERGALEASSVQGAVLARLHQRLADFPAYCHPRAVILLREPWTIEEGLLTPTFKLKRSAIEGRFASQIERLYRAGR